MLVTYLLKLDHSLDSATWEKWYHLLDLERREKIKYLKFYGDKLRSLTAGILLKTMLFNYCGLPPDEMIFSTSKYGKPILVSRPTIFFNLTHSGDYVCCSISSAPVGLDIEDMRLIDIEGISSFFSDPEQDYIHSKKNELEQLEALYSIWTLKEAFSKQIGLGLSLPLNSYSFALSEKKINLISKLECNVQFGSRTIDNQYKFAICSPILSQNIEKKMTLTEFIQEASSIY